MIGFSRLDAALRRLRPAAAGRAFARLAPAAGAAGVAAAAGFLLAAAAPSAAHAQQINDRNTLVSEDPAVPNHKIERKKGFNLFALGDLGVSGMKMTGRHGWAVTSYGPCSDGFIVAECGDVQLNNNAFQFELFEMNIYAGTPPGDFAKIVAAYPGAAAAQGGGYTAIFDDLLFGARVELGPADGSAGRLFSGVTSTADNTCRDNTGALNGYVSTGFSLLAQSDCPDTWAGNFDGIKLLADTAYLPQFQANPSTFTFTPYRVPNDIVQSSELAGNFSTYGTMSDHFQEILKSYGNITKAGADLGYGAPSIPGYPLGLDFRFDAFQFAYAPVQNTVYYQLLVINNSAKIYGKGIDYDSLYIGLRPGFGRGQATNVYYVPSRNAVMTAESNTSHKACNGAIQVPGTPPCGSQGFNQGATGIVILKSPIGDARNKLLSANGSQFNKAGNTNPAKGDTITFNHGHLCSFTNCWAATWSFSDKRAFGLFASKGDVYLDGRDPNSLSNGDFYNVLRNLDFPARTPKFNAYVPGNWDYNHDGVPDTLHFDTCGPAGCVTTWADTMPGTTRYVDRRSNVGGVAGVGPIKLKAGDTTMFVFAFIGAPDSTSFEKLVNSTTDVYNSFFLVPKPAPVPHVAVIAPRAAQDSTPAARFTFTTEAATYTDLFLQNFANNVANNPRPDFAILNALNPNLSAQIAAQAANGGNLLEIQIYKSCDLGRTFTADATCNAAPLVNQNGAPVGTGYRPYAVITPDATGKINNVFTDVNVIAGKTYLYSIVTKTRGFTTTVIDSLPGVPGHFSRTLTVVDTTYSPLARNGPTVAKVYVPLSYAAGAVSSSAVVQLANTKATVPVTALVQPNGTASGTFRLVFGNKFIIVDSLNRTTNARKEAVTVQNVAATAQVTSGGTTTTVTNYVRSQQTFTGTAPVDLSGTATTTTTTATVGTNSYTITTRTVTGTGFLLIDANGAPLFVSTTLTSGNVTPQTFFSRADFPGFAIDLNNANSAGTNPDLERIVGPKGDTVVAAIQNAQQVALQYVESRSKANNGASGEYDFVFQSDAFGPGAPFNPNRNADTLQAQVLRSLYARPTVTVADTSAATIALVQKQFSGLAGRSFVAAKLPFSVTNVTFGRPATVVVPRRTSTRVRIGIPTSPDTLVINVPDSLWIPGDTIYLVESMQRDSTVGGALVVNNGAVVTTNTPIVTLGPVVLDCSSALSGLRPACNPLALNTPAATGYFTYAPGTKLVVRYPTLFAAGDTVNLTVTPSVQRPNVVTAANLKNIRVVPNPYVVQSQFDAVNNSGIGDPRIIFTGVPAQGNLRIYSVSGQFLQERNWTPADLNGTGDYAYDLRTREGLDLASGLYIYVIRGIGASGKTEIARGKFVIIR